MIPNAHVVVNYVLEVDYIIAEEDVPKNAALNVKDIVVNNGHGKLSQYSI